ncbi:TetR family transcriptional regulator [Rhizobium sp. CRIBSB]|nr:TetR family transcriptional regulator [Rhizobium sp. CRIBSB]
MTAIEYTAATDHRRTSILRHARDQFVREGYTAARMEPIARQAGVSTATLYATFASKEVLFSAVIDDASDDFATQMAAVHALDGDARVQLTTFIAAYARFMSDPFVRSIFRLVMAERPRFRDVAMKFFERGRDYFGAALIRSIMDLNQRGELSCEKPSWAAGQLMGMVEHPVFFVPLVTGDEVKSTRSIEQITEDAVATFLARYGRQG